MNYLSDTLYETREELYDSTHTEQLEEQLTMLNEWKMKAKVQLEYFRAACRLYNFCDVNEVNELLNE